MYINFIISLLNKIVHVIQTPKRSKTLPISDMNCETLPLIKFLILQKHDIQLLKPEFSNDVTQHKRKIFVKQSPTKKDNPSTKTIIVILSIEIMYPMRNLSMRRVKCKHH